jgi:hypothetical protein
MRFTIESALIEASRKLRTGLLGHRKKSNSFKEQRLQGERKNLNIQKQRKIFIKVRMVNSIKIFK